MQQSDYNYLRHSAVFARIASLGSFRAAALELSLSPAYVSQLISELEEYLGAQLFYRSTRRLSLTDAGAAYLAKAEAILELYENALDALRDDAQVKGELHVSAATIFARAPFARFVSQFAKAYPQLALDVRFSDEFDQPAERGIDLALRVVGWPEDDPRPARKLFESEAIIVASSELAARIEHVDDLAREVWLRPNSALDRLPIYRGDQQLLLRAQRSLNANSSEFLQNLCEQGAGFLVAPEFSQREALQAGRVVRVLSDWRMEAVGVYALYSARRARLSNARQFVEALKLWLDERG